MSQPANAIVLLLDRSGSMASIRDNTIKSLNGYLEEVRAKPVPDLTFTLITFDTISTDVVHRRKPMAEVPDLTLEDLVPRASTPLIDAIGFTIATARAEYGDCDRMAFVIVTDGHENSSREFTLAQLHMLIKERAAAGWDFAFIGASIDAYRDSGRFGIQAAMAMSYDADDLGASRAAYRATARRASTYFATGTRSSFTDTEKRAAGDKFMPKRP